MENKPKEPTYTFLHSKAVMDQLYPLDMMEDDFIEKAYMSWRGIQTIHTRKHVFIGEVDVNNNLELPENVEFIRSVNYPFNIYLNSLSSFYIYINGSRLLTTDDISEWESYNIDSSIEARRGDYITYELLEDGLITFPQGDLRGSKIAVLYDGLIVDENCDPKLLYKEMIGIAHGVAYMKLRFNAYANIVGADKLLSLAKQESSLALVAATIPEYITDNEWNDVMNTKMRWDRKAYNSNYKFKL